ncbi:PREDICTED: uncharacterized protein LOC18596502 [Theobroma cacao]|uniref:Uncharacterized protein LOC18596502 n=1 Tax=Theobroma cacao TaxID=3641 RepID=A0AB32WHF0_THECC|nr:PREDICTED: uncharacterized protein LOC18596502 [Theobroma cacao]
MEAALCLGYGPLPSISLRMPSSTNVTSPASTKLYFGYNHSSMSVSSGFTNRRKCHHFYSTSGPLALDRSNNSMPSAKEDGGKVVRGAVGASLALACALSIIGCSCKMNLKAIAGPKQQVYRKAPSFQQLTPQPPKKMALKSLLDVTVILTSKDETRVKEGITLTPSPTLRQPFLSKQQIEELKLAAVGLMKRGKPDQALQMLKNEHKRLDGESAYEMSMVLAEILISQGKYLEALNFLPADHDQHVSEFDVRPILYKAIVYTMLDKEDDAQRLWKEFAKSSEVSPSGS